MLVLPFWTQVFFWWQSQQVDVYNVQWWCLQRWCLQRWCLQKTDFDTMCPKWNDGCCPFLAENIFFWASGWKSTSFLEWWVSSEAHQRPPLPVGVSKSCWVWPTPIEAQQPTGSRPYGPNIKGLDNLGEQFIGGDCNYKGNLSKLNKSLWTTAHYWWIGHWITPDLTWLDCRIGGFKSPDISWFQSAPRLQRVMEMVKVSIGRKLWDCDSCVPTWQHGSQGYS